MKALVPVVIVACSILMFGQVRARPGSITGTIQDESGAFIPGAAVTVIGPGGTVSVVSDATGSYTVPNLPVGTYSVSAALPGFSTERSTNVEVAGGAATGLVFKLRVQGSRPFLPPSPRDRNFNIVADTQTNQGASILYRGNVRMTTDSMQLVADELDFNTTT